MANWQQGLQGGLGGAAGGAAFGPTGAAIMGGVGLLAGFLGGGPKLPAELKRLYRFQYGQADQMRRFAQSVPLSDPQEQAALASQRGLLGEQQRNDAANLASQYNTFGQGNNNAGDFLTNISNQQQGQQSALYSSAMQNALQRRFEAIGQSANIAQGAVGAASQYQQQPSLAGNFGDLARLIAYNQTIKANQPQGPAGGNSPASAGVKPAGGSPGGEGIGKASPGSEAGNAIQPATTQYASGGIGGMPPNTPGPTQEMRPGQAGYPAYGSLSPADLLMRATGRY